MKLNDLSGAYFIVIIIIFFRYKHNISWIGTSFKDQYTKTLDINLKYDVREDATEGLLISFCLKNVFFYMLNRYLPKLKEMTKGTKMLGGCGLIVLESYKDYHP